VTNYIERYWRDAKPEDAIKEPPMVARFRDEHYQDWVIDELIYWDRSETPWHRDDGFCYERCQVYDAPDPGEGWRLIDIEKEKPKTVDEVYANGSWLARPYPFDVDLYDKGRFYRRRITPAVTYVPFTWEDREQLRGRKVFAKEPHRQVEFTCDVFQLNDGGTFFINEFYSVWLCKNAVFVDTKEPVGKEVTQ